jgi:hypothetical protein
MTSSPASAYEIGELRLRVGDGDRGNDRRAARPLCPLCPQFASKFAALITDAELREACSTPKSCPADRRSDIDSLETTARSIATWSLAAGGILGSAGVLLLLVNPTDARPGATTTAPMP